MTSHCLRSALKIFSLPRHVRGSLASRTQVRVCAHCVLAFGKHGSSVNSREQSPATPITHPANKRNVFSCPQRTACTLPARFAACIGAPCIFLREARVCVYSFDVDTEFYARKCTLASIIQALQCKPTHGARRTVIVRSLAVGE